MLQRNETQLIAIPLEKEYKSLVGVFNNFNIPQLEVDLMISEFINSYLEIHPKSLLLLNDIIKEIFIGGVLGFPLVTAQKEILLIQLKEFLLTVYKWWISYASVNLIKTELASNEKISVYLYEINTDVLYLIIKREIENEHYIPIKQYI